MKPGGECAISDGNNLAHLKTRLDLIELYNAWENGPYSKEFKDNCYRLTREGIIRKNFPALDEDQVKYLAANTSGLFDEGLLESVRAFVNGEAFVERPYRPGICPTNPRQGVIMEGGFFPDQVERALMLQGFDAAQLYKGKVVTDVTDRGRTKNFVIRGVKLPEDVAALQAYAERDHANRYDQLKIESAANEQKVAEKLGVVKRLFRKAVG